MKITADELDLVRQWFDAAQDLNCSYLDLPDYRLARKIYMELGIRVPSSILEVEEQKSQSEMMAKWVVDVKGEAGSICFEITVLRDNNERGKKSFGLIGEDKLLITHDAGPCHWPLTQIVWDKSVKLAHEVAGELNDSEGINV